ncbi:ABC transporter permease [Georgenia thermotolerans]|uniref:ABC transporter permease n=1 Tax=Georgenia thermotolerans TaxID=527326 RepID=A0A7J5UTZ8_9MICO|nr:ABC transporter permease [Georgenia thermotolerans]KAE8765761.1 ABC transporter permease [Georgenia thermotolerans]
MTTTSTSSGQARAGVTQPGPKTAPGPLGRAGRVVLQRYGLVLLWLLMIALFGVLVPGQVSGPDALKAVLGQQTPLVFLGLALVCTMAVGEFDLSFASIFGLAATTVPALVVLYGWSFPAAAAAAVVVAAVIGAINAALVVLVGINSVIVTLGIGSVAGGAAYWISKETSVSGMDSALSAIALDRFLGLPLLFWYGAILVAAFAYMMGATPLGRHILFVGSNREVARLAGIPVTKVRMGAYLTSALICGVGGVIIAAGLGGFDPATAETNLMPTFASVFLGTVAVVPGRFNPVGMFIAVYFLLTGVFGLQLLSFSGWVTNVFYGIALVLAVTVSFLLQRRVRG